MKRRLRKNVSRTLKFALAVMMLFTTVNNLPMTVIADDNVEETTDVVVEDTSVDSSEPVVEPQPQTVVEEPVVEEAPVVEETQVEEVPTPEIVPSVEPTVVPSETPVVDLSDDNLLDEEEEVVATVVPTTEPVVVETPEVKVEDALTYNFDFETQDIMEPTKGFVGDVVKVAENTLVREGYNFLYWYVLNEDGTETIYNANDEYTLTDKDDVLTAKWEEVVVEEPVEKEGTDSENEVSEYTVNSEVTYNEDNTLATITLTLDSANHNYQLDVTEYSENLVANADKVVVNEEGVVVSVAFDTNINNTYNIAYTVTDTATLESIDGVETSNVIEMNNVELKVEGIVANDDRLLDENEPVLYANNDVIEIRRGESKTPTYGKCRNPLHRDQRHSHSYTLNDAITGISVNNKGQISISENVEVGTKFSINHTINYIGNTNCIEERLNFVVVEKLDPELKNQSVYLYGLRPGGDMYETQNPDSNWYGLGVTEANLPDVNKYTEGADVTDVLKEHLDLSGMHYPPLTINGKEYQYDSTKTTAQSYSIQWLRGVVADGANAGANDHNKPVIPNGERTYHYDAIIALNETGKSNISFMLKNPNANNYTVMDKYYYLVENGTKESVLSKPTTEDLADKNVNGIQYKFDGWYRDSECTKKANFDGSVNANVSYYGRYVPKDTYTVTYNLNGGKTTSNTTIFTGLNFGTETPRINEPTKTGYTFAGWDPEVNNTVNGNATYTAKWDKNSNDTKELSYKVNYIVKGEDQPRESKNYTVNIWVNENEYTVATVEEKTISGYKVSENESTQLPATVENGGEINVVYVVDETAKLFDYTINYLEKETEKQLAESTTGKGHIGEIITVEAKPIRGYLPVEGNEQSLTVTEDNQAIVNVYYEKNLNDTKELSYKVNHIVDGETRDTDTVTTSIWINDEDLTVLDVEDINYRTYEGFVVDTYATVIPETIAVDGVINVYYEADNRGTDPNNPTNPDGIPDKYQVKVDYNAVNGSVSPDYLYVTLTKGGKYASAADGGSYVLTAKDLPTASANGGYHNGVWDVTPVEGMVITKDTVFTITYSAVPVDPVNPPVNPKPVEPVFTCPEGTVWNDATGLCEAEVVVVPPVNPVVPGGPDVDDEGDVDPVVPEEVVDVEDNDTPQAGGDVEVIEDDVTPEVGAKGSWALINLIATVLGAILAIILLLSKHDKTEEDEEDPEAEEVEYTRRRKWKVISTVVAIVSIVVFFLTENMRLPMVWVDKWTLLMLLFFLVNAISLYMGRRFHEVEDEEESTNA